MGVNRSKLQGLITLITEIAKNEKDEWFVRNLLSKLGNTSSTSATISDATQLDDIYEYCIEENIRLQAEEFYRDFPIAEIKDELIQDFAKMEHDRRRGDFHGFCLNMFLQVEGVVNYSFQKTSIPEKIFEDLAAPAYSRWNKKDKSFERTGSELLIAELLMKRNQEWQPGGKVPYYYFNDIREVEKYFDENRKPIVDYNPNKKSWSFQARLRAVLYYLYFDSSVTKNQFKEKFDPLGELYVLRNTIHRQSTPGDYQIKIIKSWKENKARSYLQSYGMLCDFIQGVSKGLELEQKPTNQIIMEPQSN